jgi:thiol:disulfide interchange protein DsbD
LGLKCFKDFEAGLAESKASGKPILLDFTGWACVNCRKMEEQVWSNPEVFRRIQQEFVLISLYVDERKLLPEDQQFTYSFENGTRKHITSVGDYWSTFQNLNFGAVSQPYYVLLSPSLEILGPAVQNTDVDSYRIWLDKGLEAYTKDPFGAPEAIRLP